LFLVIPTTMGTDVNNVHTTKMKPFIRIIITHFLLIVTIFTRF